MGSVSGITALAGTPKSWDIEIGTANASGVVNVGDFVAYSGSAVFATTGHTFANKASAAGIALESNPQYDSFGNIVTATALKYARQGIFRVSGGSGAAAWCLGQPVYPSATGSGVAAPTGLTGLGALWTQTTKTGAGSGFSTGIAIVVGFVDTLANSAQLDILLTPPAPDYV